MRISEISISDLVDYCRAEDGADTALFLYAALGAAKGYIKSRNGIDDAYMDAHEELTIAVLALVADMYDNRSLTIAGGKENPTITAILKMHDKNFI